MNPSTASFIAYDLRPAKQTERRILLDFLKCANEAEINISDCRYVGMGGTKFYDFHLFHRFLGVHQMTSLERDPELFYRAAFNCPYGFIKVKQKTVGEFLASDKETSRTIYWLDYDGGLSSEIIADITALGAKLTAGGFAFVTVNADFPHFLETKPKETRLEHFQQILGDFSINLNSAQIEKSVFADTVYRVLVAAFKNAFAARLDGYFHLLFKVQYQDSRPMITVGGCFCSNDQSASIQRRMKVDVPFLLNKQPYKIDIRKLTLTDSERTLFDVAVTKRRTKSRQATLLLSLGFSAKDLKSYQDLVRFLPRYHESII